MKLNFKKNLTFYLSRQLAPNVVFKGGNSNEFSSNLSYSNLYSNIY